MPLFLISPPDVSVTERHALPPSGTIITLSVLFCRGAANDNKQELHKKNIKNE
jgi:hypothetical protein